MLYFSYGSNMSTRRIGRRVPSPRPVAVARLSGHELCFHKVGKDGSAKCDAPEASANSLVHGALYRISAHHIRELARIEGVGTGYEESRVTIETGSGQASAFLFQAQPEFIDSALLPFDWYKALVIEGTRFHRFPAEYVGEIEAVPSIADPDTGRAVRNWALVEKIRRATLEPPP